jgi:hypothetical protein
LGHPQKKGDVCGHAQVLAFLVSTDQKERVMTSATGRALGISDDVISDLITMHWERWRAVVPVLAGVPEPEVLAQWLQAAPRAAVDGVLGGLAELAAQTGHDDRQAALVLAWLLHPGADALSIRLCDLGPDVVQHVAAYLWIEIRTFAWETKTHVAANILLRVRQRVLIEYGTSGQLENHDRARARTAPMSPDLLQGLNPAAVADAPRDQLEDLLAWACEHWVISNRERQLLLALVEAADVHPIRERASTALLSRLGTEMVGQSWGMSAREVRRSAKASIEALAAALGPAA